MPGLRLGGRAVLAVKLPIKESYCSQVAEEETAFCRTLQEDSDPIKEDTLYSSFPALELMAVTLPMTASLLSSQEVKAAGGTVSTREWGWLSSSKDLSSHRLSRDWK